MSSYNYNQFERMSREEKDRRCDGNDQIIHEMIHRRTERERLFDYNVQRKLYGDDSNRNQFKRQLTSTSQVDGYDVYEADDNNPFTFISRGAKRKPKGSTDNENNGNKDNVILDIEHATTTTSNGGRLFINSRNRTNKNVNDADNESYHARRYQHSKKIERNKQNKMISDDENDIDFLTPTPKMRTNDNENEKENEKTKKEKISITKHALQYAVEHHLPPLYIQCQPKLDNHDEAKEIIKSLFNHVEKNFRHLNKSYKFPVGFDYWYINKDGNLTCYTRHIELFVYLSEPNNYPTNINNTEIIPCRPKHLPPQNTIILKFIPNYITQEEIHKELNLHLDSLYNVEEMKGSKTEKFRHVRIELKSNSEYEQLLRSGGITIDGHLIGAEEFLAPPRLLMCTKCNDPGHIRKNCSFEYDACRRCGEDRLSGDHNQCLIRCHRCQQNHLSTDYKCQFLVDYRRTLLNQLKEKPNLLPPNVRIFIPVDCRDRGNKNNKILVNPKSNRRTPVNNQHDQTPFNIDSFSWPTLTNKSHKQPNEQANEQAIWNDLRTKQEEINKLKEEFNLKLLNHQAKYNDHLKKMNVVLLSVAQQTKQQNESVERCYTTINEVLPILSSAFEIIQRIVTKINSTNGNDTDSGDTQEILYHVAQSLEFIKDRNELLVNNQKALSNLVEQQGQLMIQGINSLITIDEQ